MKSFMLISLNHFFATRASFSTSWLALAVTVPISEFRSAAHSTARPSETCLTDYWPSVLHHDLGANLLFGQQKYAQKSCSGCRGRSDAMRRGSECRPRQHRNMWRDNERTNARAGEPEVQIGSQTMFDQSRIEWLSSRWPFIWIDRIYFNHPRARLYYPR